MSATDQNKILGITVLFAIQTKATDSLSCQERCGESYNSSYACQCTDDCSQYGNCCEDFIGTCTNASSCQRRCGENYNSANECHCNTLCPNYGNCCEDFHDICIVSCNERCLEEDHPPNSVCRCDSRCKEFNNCCDDFDDVCKEEQYFCNGECNVDRIRCSCKEGCMANNLNKTCCTDYGKTCLNGTTWLEEECASPDVMGCPVDFDTPPVILFSIDGFRSEYLYRHLTPNIWKLASCGTHAPYMRSVFPTKTFPNHYSIVTGLYPESHGIIDNTIYDHELQEEFRLGAPESFNPAWWGGEPIWVTTSNQGKVSACYFWPGSDVNITRYPDYYRKYDGSVDNEERMYQALDWLQMAKDERPSFITLYMDFVDGAGHDGGPSSPDVNNALVEADFFIGMLMDGLKQMNLENCVNLIILADHGMAPTSCDRKSNIEQYGVDLDTVYTRTGAFARIGKSEDPLIWDLFDPEDTQNKLRCTRDESHWLSYLKYQYLPKRYHYAYNDRIDPVILEMDDEWLVEGRKNSNNFCNGGTHGYDNEYKSMHALFTAHGPGFKRSFNTSEPFENIEVYKLMTDLLNLEAAPNNGTSGSLNHLMTSPPTLTKPSLPSVPQCTPPENNQADPSCNCWNISQSELNSRLKLDENQTTTSIETHFPLGVASVQESNHCHLPNLDYINVFNKARKIAKYVSFTLDRKDFDLAAPEDCLLDDIRLTETATCGQYESNTALHAVSLYPSELSNGDAIFDATILSNQVPMYEPARQVWNYTARAIADWSARFNGIHVISGPIFDYNYDGLADSDETLNELGTFLNGDDSLPAIPTHFFIIALRCKEVGTSLSDCLNSPDDVEVLSFVIPNYEVEPCHTKEQTPFEWIPATMKEHVARVRDVELMTGITFFPDFYSDDINSAIRFKVRLPQFTSEWMEDFLNTRPPQSSVLTGSASNLKSLSFGLQVMLLIYWTLMAMK